MFIIGGGSAFVVRHRSHHMTQNRKYPGLLGFGLLFSCFVVAIAYRSIIHHYFPALEPAASSPVAHISTVALLAMAAVFYIAVIGLAIVARRSWMDLLAVGAMLTVICFATNVAAPPFGAVIFLGIHIVWCFVWVRSILQKRRIEHDHDA